MAKILEKNNHLLQARNSYDQTILSMAVSAMTIPLVSRGQVPTIMVIKYLVEELQLLTLINPVDQTLAVQTAILGHHWEIARYLLSQIRSLVDATFLLHATIEDTDLLQTAAKAAVITLLLKKGADLDYKVKHEALLQEFIL